MRAIPNETEALARLLAVRTGKTPEDVIREAVAASARALGVPGVEVEIADSALMIEAANVIARRCASRPILDTRSEDEILDYDEYGIPR